MRSDAPNAFVRGLTDVGRVVSTCSVAVATIGTALAITLGIYYVLWYGWNWAIPQIVTSFGGHGGRIDNFWVFVVGAFLISAIGGWLRGSTKAVRDR